MKKLISYLVLVLLLAGARPLAAQDWPEEYLGLPGDNLNLYAVMNLFQESETLEGFEKSLNDPKTIINNLDLNGNNLVDYIMVFDYKDGDVHNIVLRVALNQDEYQDVAVFTVEKFRDGSVQIQLIGDEALYGKNYIIEPFYAETPNPGYTGKVIHQKKSTRRNVTVVHTTYYEVASWPVIVYLSRPNYRAWRSTWGWGYYPAYWTPWAPSYWHYYYGYHYNHYNHYYAYYRPWNHYRCSRYHTVYHSRIRNYSPTVVVNINKGSYKNTYSRPDKRKEGEVLYAHRRANGGTTLSARGQSSNSAEVRQSSGQTNQVSQRAERPANEVRRTTVGNTTRSKGVARQNTEVSRQKESSQKARVSRNDAAQKRATPKRGSTVSAEKASTRDPKRQATASPKRDMRTTPNKPAVRSRDESRSKSIKASQPAKPVNKSTSRLSSSGNKKSSNNRTATQVSKPGNNNRSSSNDRGSSRKGRR